MILAIKDEPAFQRGAGSFFLSVAKTTWSRGFSRLFPPEGSTPQAILGGLVLFSQYRQSVV
jgi:hypothetical protein